MKYIFILGRIPTVSVAEILSVFRRDSITCKIIALSGEAMVAETEKPIKDEQSFLNKLGGTIKIIEVLGEVGKVSDLKTALTADALIDRYPYVQNEIKNISFSKFYWGLSVYFLCEAKLRTKQKIVDAAKSCLIGVKETLRARQLRCRIVTPPPGKLALDAPSVAKNGLLKKGGEIVIAVDKEKVYWGKTLAVQDFRFYGLRDYGKPGRDMKVGMMPPKLAQVMLNLSNALEGEIILDPFCGTGVVLQEALLAGFKAIGADKSKEILALSKLNLEWLEKELEKKSMRLLKEKTDLKLIQADAANIGKFIDKKSISAIVTEGTLGPKYGRVSPSANEMSNNFKMLESLHIAAFKEFKSMLKDNGRVIVTFPVYMLKRGKEMIFSPFIDKIIEIGYSIIHPLNGEKMPENAAISLSKRGTIVYSRPDQNVGREIIIFSKKITS